MKILSHLNTLQENKYFKKIKSTLRLLLGVPLTLVSLYFLFASIFTYKDTIISSIQQTNFFLLSIGLLFFSIFFYIKAFIWYKLLPKGERSVPHLFYDYQLSEIARYAPFNIASFVSRVHRFEHKKLPKKQLLQLMGVELIVVLLGACIICLPALSSVLNRYTAIPNIELNATLIILASFILLLMFARKILLRILTLFKVNCVPLLLSTISWICYSLGSYFIAISLSYLDPFQFTYFLSLFTLGWLAGFLAFVIPMGIGVREFVVIAGLTPFTTIPLATAIVAMQRVIFTLSEVINLCIAFYVLKNDWLRKIVHKLYQYRIEMTVFIFTSIYAIYFSFLSMEKHNNFFTGRFDLGNMDQTVWNTLQGRIFLYTNPDSTETVSRLSAHADFILILLAPFYLVWSDPRMLLIIQSVILSLGAVFVYLISNTLLRHKYASLVFAISYLLNPFIQRQNLYDFHAVTLATTFLLATFYFLLKKRFILFSLFLILAVLTKEHMFLIAFFFGCYLVGKKYKVAGILLAVLSFITFYLVINTFIPDARGGSHFALSYYDDFGDSPTAIVRGLISNPLRTFDIILTPLNMVFLHNLYSSVGYLVLMAPQYLIFALGDFAVSLLSTNGNLKSIHYHYAAAIIPFIYISAIYGFKKISAFPFMNQKVLIGYVLIAAIFSTWANGVLPGSRYPHLDVYTRRLSYKEDVYKFIESIPPELSVATTNNIGAHFTQREHIYTLPQGFESADIIVFLLTDKYENPIIIELANDLSQNPSYIELVHIEEFRAFAKRSVASTLLNRIAIGEIQK